MHPSDTFMKAMTWRILFSVFELFEIIFPHAFAYKCSVKNALNNYKVG
jgi:hypothetical protein